MLAAPALAVRRSGLSLVGPAVPRRRAVLKTTLAGPQMMLAVPRRSAVALRRAVAAFRRAAMTLGWAAPPRWAAGSPRDQAPQPLASGRWRRCPTAGPIPGA